MQKISAETARYQPIAISRPTSRPGRSDADGPVADRLGAAHRARAAASFGAARMPAASAIVPVYAGRGRRCARELALDELVVGLEAAAPARQHDRADGGHQQQQRRDLEREQVGGQEQLADVRGRAEAEHVGRALAVDPLQRRCRASRCTARSRARARTAARGSRSALAAAPARRRRRRRRRRTRTGPSPRRRRRHLGGGDELGPQQQEQRRQRDQVDRRARARCRTGCGA